jgi:hypothetical protein
MPQVRVQIQGFAQVVQGVAVDTQRLSHSGFVTMALPGCGQDVEFLKFTERIPQGELVLDQVLDQDFHFSVDGKFAIFL